MSFISDLFTNITAFRVTIGDKLLSLASRLGNLSLLTTSSKSNLVDAVNEVNASIGQQKSKTIALTNAFRKTVIPLCIIDNVNASLNSYFYGNIYAKRNNALDFRSTRATIDVAKMYNESNAIVNVSFQVPPISSVFRPVTFTYLGIKYFGLEIGAAGSTASFDFAIVEGAAGDWAYINAIDYYNTQGNTVINTEINTSIAEYVYVNDNYNKIEKSLFKFQAQTFLKTGKDDTTIMLSGGGDKPLTDFVLASQLPALVSNKANTNGSNTIGGSWKIDYVLSDVLTNAVGNGQVIGVFSNGTVDYGSDVLNGHRFRVKTSVGLKVYVSGLGEGQVWHQFNFDPADYATKTFVNTSIANLKFVSRTYDVTDVNNNDRYIGSNIISSHTVEGFDVCVYNPGDNGFITPFAGGGNLHNAFMGILGIQVGSDVVIKGAVQSQNDLSPFIGNNQVYFCLAYIFTSGGATGIIQFMSMADIYNHKASATASESKDVIIIGEIGAPDVLLLNQREV